MKTILQFTFTLFLCTLIAHQSEGQIGEFSFQNNILKRETVTIPQLKITLLKGQAFRHGALWYHPTKVNDEHVFSIAQPNGIFDNTYYVDQNGTTQFRSIACTAPMNRYPGSQVYDSFNPYGATTIGESISQGLMNMLFNKLLD